MGPMTTEDFARLMGATVVGQLPFRPDGLAGVTMAAEFYRRRMALLRAEEQAGKPQEGQWEKLEVGFKPEVLQSLKALAKETKTTPAIVVSEITEHFFRSLQSSAVLDASVPKE